MLPPSEIGAVLVDCRVVSPEQWARVPPDADLDGMLDALVATAPWWWDGPGQAPPGLTAYQENLTRDRAEADDPAGLKSGLTLNQFLLLGHLGEGGQGRVYFARQLRPARYAAVKTLTRDTEPARMRFEQEAKAMMDVAHPAVARFYQYERVRDAAGRLTNDYLIAMEYVEGKDLFRLVRKGGPVPWRFAVRWTVQLLTGLDYLHTRGFIHRDVKPENVMAVGPVAGWGDPRATRVKLLDLGAVKPAGGDDVARAVGGRVFVGTPEYAPPEQWSGELVPASDLYAAGGTLFFVLTDRTPYQKEKRDAFAYMKSHVDDPVPDVRKFNPDVPKEVADAIVRMMAKAPADRGSARQLIADLTKLVDDADTPTKRPAGRKAPRPLPAPPPAAAKPREEYEPRNAPGPFDAALAGLERIFIPSHKRPQPGDELTTRERVLALIRRPLVLVLFVIALALAVWCLW